MPAPLAKLYVSPLSPLDEPFPPSCLASLGFALIALHFEQGLDEHGIDNTSSQICEHLIWSPRMSSVGCGSSSVPSPFLIRIGLTSP